MIWSKTFFEWCTHPDWVSNYRKDLQEELFNAMEATKQPYESLISMPVKRFKDFLKWKADLEEQKAKMLEAAKSQMSRTNMRKR